MKSQQARFAQEYTIDLNATQAAIRAGYSAKTAYSIGNELLKKPEVQKLIKDFEQARSERTAITADKVLQELAKVGFCNIQDYIQDGNKILNLKRITRDKASSVEAIRITESELSDGSKKTITSFKLYDKVAALEKLGRHLGIFEKDNNQKGDKIVIDSIDYSKLTDEQLAFIAGLPAKTSEV